jgi:hypothetical protein
MKWCNYCHAYKESWADNPSYRSSETYRRYDRCWSCDKWTLCCHHGCHGCCDHGVSEALRSANSSLSSQNSSLQSQLASKNTEINAKDSQIARTETELTNVRSQLNEEKGLSKVKDEKIEKLSSMFNDLQLESINKDKEIEVRGKNIENLEKKVDEKENENFGLKIKEQERKLDEFVQKLGIGREKPRELRKAYQRLIKARENYNRDDIMEAEDDIEMIKDELLSSGWIKRGMSLENVQKLCNKCGRIADLKIEQWRVQEKMYQRQKLIQYQEQQFQAQQEQPTNNN